MNRDDREEFNLERFQRDPTMYRERFPTSGMLEAETAKRRVLKKRIGYAALTSVAAAGIAVGVESMTHNWEGAVIIGLIGALAIGWLVSGLNRRLIKRQTRN